GAYATRAWLRTFFGERPAVSAAEPEPGTAHAHTGREAPASMLVPIVVLAVPALLLGFVGVADVHGGAAVISVVLALLGAGIVYVSWRSDPAADPARVLGPFRVPCERAFFVDALYRLLVVRPTVALSRAVKGTDTGIVDGAVRGSA